MNDLKQLIEARDTEFKSKTKLILKEMIHVLRGTIKVLRLETEAANGNLVWEDVSLVHDELEDDDFIMLVGAISYTPGESFTLPNGRDVKVTEDTVEYFRRLIRVGIPLSIAVDGDIDDVVEFLHKSIEEAEEDSGLIISSLDDDSEEFDLDDLSDTQREALLLFSKTAGGRN